MAQSTLSNIRIYDWNNNEVDTAKFEATEQKLCKEYIKEDDVVLELGARYGSISCTINRKLNCLQNHVAVEPDQRVWAALERNRDLNGCGFHVVKGFLSRKKLSLTNLDDYHGYGATSVNDEATVIPSFTLEDIYKLYGLRFNVLVADCEGFLETFFDKNPQLINDLRLVIFEADYASKCDYTKIRNFLKEHDFVEIQSLSGGADDSAGFQNVWGLRNQTNLK